MKKHFILFLFTVLTISHTMANEILSVANYTGVFIKLSYELCGEKFSLPVNPRDIAKDNQIENYNDYNSLVLTSIQVGHAENPENIKNISIEDLSKDPEDPNFLRTSSVVGISNRKTEPVVINITEELLEELGFKMQDLRAL